jgi:hypothetical protein
LHVSIHLLERMQRGEGKCCAALATALIENSGDWSDTPGYDK